MSRENELKRVAFIEQRDGVEAAIAFCRQGMMMYHEALRKFAKQPMYRRQYIESMLYWRSYIRSRRAIK